MTFPFQDDLGDMTAPIWATSLTPREKLALQQDEMRADPLMAIIRFAYIMGVEQGHRVDQTHIREATAYLDTAWKGWREGTPPFDKAD